MYLKPQDAGFKQRSGRMVHMEATHQSIREYPWIHCGRDARVIAKGDGTLYSCPRCGITNYRAPLR